MIIKYLFTLLVIQNEPVWVICMNVFVCRIHMLQFYSNESLECCGIFNMNTKSMSNVEKRFVECIPLFRLCTNVLFSCLILWVPFHQILLCPRAVTKWMVVHCLGIKSTTHYISLLYFRHNLFIYFCLYCFSMHRTDIHLVTVNTSRDKYSYKKLKWMCI